MPTILPVATSEVIRHPSDIPPESRTGRRLSSEHGGTGRTAVAAGDPGQSALRVVLFYDTPDAPTGGSPGAGPGLGGPGRVRGRSAGRSVAALAMTLMTGAMAAMFLRSPST